MNTQLSVKKQPNLKAIMDNELLAVMLGTAYLDEKIRTVTQSTFFFKRLCTLLLEQSVPLSSRSILCFPSIFTPILSYAYPRDIEM